MRSNSLRSKRLIGWACTAVSLASLVAACGNDGGQGDGVIDDSIPPAGRSNGSAGRNDNRAGAPSGTGGTVGAGGSAGVAGTANSAGSSGSSGAATGGAASSAGATNSAGSNNAGATVGGGGQTGSAGAGGGSAGKGGTGAGGALSSTCGDSKVDTGEQCDDGLGFSAGSGGTSAGSGGMSGGAPKADYGQLCSNSCTKISTPTCLACENAGDCVESVNNCLGFDAPFNAAQQSACFAVLSCVQKSNCADGTASLGACFCGSLDTAACGAAPFTGAGAPNGACVAQFKAGFPTLTSNQDILGALYSIEFPGGAALKRLNCQKVAVNNQNGNKTCEEDCGFKTGGPAFP